MENIVEQLMLSDISYTGVYKSPDDRVTYQVEILLAKLDQYPFDPNEPMPTLDRTNDNETSANKFQTEWNYILWDLNDTSAARGGDDILNYVQMYKLKCLIHEYMLPFMLVLTYNNALYNHYNNDCPDHENPLYGQYNKICPSAADKYYYRKLKLLLQYYWEELRFSLLRTLEWCAVPMWMYEQCGIRREGALIESIIFKLTVLSQELYRRYPSLFK
jgi:hypothetical protein